MKIKLTAIYPGLKETYLNKKNNSVTLITNFVLGTVVIFHKNISVDMKWVYYGCFR